MPECHLESDLDQLIYSYHPKLPAITPEGLLSNNDVQLEFTHESFQIFQSSFGI